MGQITLELLEEHELPIVQALFEACETYFIATTGAPAPPLAAHMLFTQLPGDALHDDKHILGICDTATREVLGVIDAVLGYPDARTVTLGLFLVTPADEDHSVRQEACRLLEEWAADRGGSAIRIAVYDVPPDAPEFWRTAGYIPTGEHAQVDARTVLFLEKSLLTHQGGRASPVAPVFHFP